MLKIYPSLEAHPIHLPIENELGKLLAACEAGAEFFLLPIHDTLSAVKWILASFHAPITVVPVSTQLPREALKNIVDALPSGKVIELSKIENLRSIKVEKIQEKELQLPWLVIFTSGSSGDPKGVVISGLALKYSAEAHASHFSLPLDHSWLLNLPLYHIGGFSIVSRAYFLNSRIALGSSKFQLDQTLEWMNSGKIEGLSLVPTILRRILDLNENCPASVKHILLGGAAVDLDILEKSRKMHFPVHLTYGMTEHSSQIATEKSAGSGLDALPGVEIKLSANNEIMVRSKFLANGYYIGGRYMPLPLKDGYFCTGDMGKFAGEKLEITGRLSDLIISGGLNIFPAEIEQELAKFPEIIDCAVCSLPSAEWGEQVVVAYVSYNSGFALEKAARDFLSHKIDGRKIPKHWFSLQQIPRSSNGKVRRQELKKLAIKSLSKA